MDVEQAEAAAIEEIEQILRATSTPGRNLGPLGGAVWFCACITRVPLSPTWVIHDGPSPGTLTWQRLPDPVWADDLPRRMTGVNVRDVVDEARIAAGGHVDPCSLRDWMRGRDELGGSVWGDEQALARLRDFCCSVPA